MIVQKDFFFFPSSRAEMSQKGKKEVSIKKGNLSKKKEERRRNEEAIGSDWGQKKSHDFFYGNMMKKS